MRIQNQNPSPVRGEAAPPVTVKAGLEQAAATAVAHGLGINKSDIDAFVAALSAGGNIPRGGSILPSMDRLARQAPKPGSPQAREAVSAASAELQQVVTENAGKLAALYKDGLVHESELMPLRTVGHALRRVMSMRDDMALAMLPRDVRQRLEQNLFGPLGGLSSVAKSQESQLFEGMEMRDKAALRERLAEPTAYRSLDLVGRSTGGNKESLSGTDRYKPGDKIAVPRSDGSTSLGVVVGTLDKDLRVEMLERDGSFLLKNLSVAEVVQNNPLKIGDYIRLGDREIWVTGLGADGKLAGRAAEKGVVCDLDHRDLQKLSSQLSDQIIAKRFAPPPPQVIPVVIPVVTPVVAAQPSGVSGVTAASVSRTGGAESVAVESVKGKTASGALFSSKGPNKADHGVAYADYNEDAAVLGVIPGSAGKAETVFAGAFDQAGGMGKVPGQTGAASRIAAEAFEAAAQAVGKGADPEKALRDAASSADTKIKKINGEYGIEAITTMAAGFISNGEAVVLNVGDSKVYHFGPDGKLKNETKAHNLGDMMAEMSGNPNDGLRQSNIVTESLGQKDGVSKPDIYRWKVGPGDYLLYTSDGIADANLSAQKKDVAAGKPWARHNQAVTAGELGAIVAKKTPEAATQAVMDYALGNMKEGKAKPDNTTAVVVRIA